MFISHQKVNENSASAFNYWTTLVEQSVSDS